MTTQPEYVLVPREPTQAMGDAARRWQHTDYVCDPEGARNNFYDGVYRAMLAAAPKAPEQTRPSSPGAGASIIVTLHDLVTCCRSWAPEARILGNIRADDAADAIEYAIAALQQPSANIEVRLFDSQWVNVVNHDNCYRDWSKEDAIAHAVRMTETLMRENVTKGFPAAPKPSAEQPSAQKAVAYCDPSDPINSTAFAWPGTDRDVARQKTPLYTAPTLRPVSNEDVEAAAETLWNTSSHKLLEKAEHPTDWKSQPETIKRDYRKQGRAALESVLARRMGGGE